MTVTNYRDLVAWKRSMELVKVIYELTKSWPKDEMYGLISQIRRAAVAVPSNIAEGHGRRSGKEFIRFLNISHGSLMEVETQIQIAYELGYVRKESCSSCLKTTNELGRIIFGLSNSVRH